MYLKKMEKINTTNKYLNLLKIVLIAMVFSVITPVNVFADWSDTYGGDSQTWVDTYGGDSQTWVDTYGGDTYNVGSSYSGTTYTPSYSYSPSYYSSGGYYANSYNLNVSYSGHVSVPSSISTVPNPMNVHISDPVIPSTGGSVNSNLLSVTIPNNYNGYSQTYYYNQPVTQVIPNQVLAYTDTNLALDSVYLSDVPYTGFTDILPIMIFIFSLLLWSGILAFVFLKKRFSSQIALEKVSTNQTTVDSTKTSKLINQINSDNSDIGKVEEYARINKVLLSSDAAIKLVKLSRLGQIRVSDYIRSVATGEWVAIGENQIK